MSVSHKLTHKLSRWMVMAHSPACRLRLNDICHFGTLNRKCEWLQFKSYQAKSQTGVVEVICAIIPLDGGGLVSNRWTDGSGENCKRSRCSATSLLRSLGVEAIPDMVNLECQGFQLLPHWLDTRTQVGKPSSSLRHFPSSTRAWRKTSSIAGSIMARLHCKGFYRIECKRKKWGRKWVGRKQ